MNRLLRARSLVLLIALLLVLAFLMRGVLDGSDARQSARQAAVELPHEPVQASIASGSTPTAIPANPLRRDLSVPTSPVPMSDIRTAEPTETLPSQTDAQQSATEQLSNENAAAEASLRVPLHWRLILNGPLERRELYQFASDFETVWSGSASARLISQERAEGRKFRPGSLVQISTADQFRGRRVRYSAQIRTRRTAPEFRASMWLRAQDSNGVVVAFQNQDGRMIRGSSQWTEHAIVLDVPADASVMVYGLFTVNAGAVWIDDVRISVVDPVTALTAPPWSVGNGVMNRPIDPNRALLAPENLGFEQTAPSDETIYWRERDPPTFRVPMTQ